MQIKERFNKKLLVEGNDDQHVIWSLCTQFEVQKVFDVIDCMGIGNLLDAVPVRFKESHIETIGIIVDADERINDRWRSIRDLLTNNNFDVPNDLPAAGLVLTREDGVMAGVWIMPDNNANGMIEDFIAFLVPENDGLLPVANDTLDTIEATNLNKYIPAHRAKAVIHSWLAWQEDPGTPMGQGITKKYLTTDKEVCKQLMAWLTALFVE